MWIAPVRQAAAARRNDDAERTVAEIPRKRTLAREPLRGQQSRHKAAPMQPETFEGREIPHDPYVGSGRNINNVIADYVFLNRPHFPVVSSAFV
jgi:hypothetical protein